jgi:glycosyltransferase involved in cell wall biosynthesis
MSPRVAIGLPAYNGGEHAREAFESLLAQTFRDFVVVAVDDGSTDGTRELAHQLAASDDRLRLHVNPDRLGMAANWRRAFEAALAAAPDAEYFAWASDHDAWSPAWLEALVAELDRSPAAVLAYPLTVRVDAEGRAVAQPWEFATSGAQSPRTRRRAAFRGMVAGDMIYGLFRRAALERTAVFPPVLIPDRLVLAELAMLGEFRQIRRVLWHRRVVAPSTARRQRRTLFAGRAPLSSLLAWWAVHAWVLFRDAGLRAALAPETSRRAGLAAALEYVALTLGGIARRLPARIAVAALGRAAALARGVLAAAPRPLRRRLGG